MGWWSSVTSAFKSFKPVVETVSAIAGAAGAIAPLIMQATADDMPSGPKVKSAAQLEAEAGAAATKRRQEIARRRGASSTYRTTKLGVKSDVYSRGTGIGGM
jgi:hypothetical protein